MPIETNYQGFIRFFSNNKEKAEGELGDLLQEFRCVFDEVLMLGTNSKYNSPQKGTAAGFYLRAAKYLFTAHELAIAGHTEESRILLRNILELLMLGFLISKENEVYSLWTECHGLRMRNTHAGHYVDLDPVRKAKYKASTIRSKYLETLLANDVTSHLYENWKEFSERYSHENLFNIAVRVDSAEGKTEVYIGDGFDAPTRRMAQTVHLTLEMLQDLRALIEDLRK